MFFFELLKERREIECSYVHQFYYMAENLKMDNTVN